MNVVGYKGFMEDKFYDFAYSVLETLVAMIAPCLGVELKG